jgi:hypothetical protein
MRGVEWGKICGEGLVEKLLEMVQVVVRYMGKGKSPKDALKERRQPEDTAVLQVDNDALSACMRACMHECRSSLSPR